MKLYSHPVQPNALRVLMFVDEKGIDLPVVDLDLFAGEHKSPEYLAKNPRGQVPALELDDGTTISESIVICRFLDESFEGPRLFGTGVTQRAQISMWERVLELGVFVPSVEYGHHTLPEMKPFFDQYPDWAESLRGGIESTLDMLAQQLARHAFVVGREFSVADITGFLGVKYAELLAGIKILPGGSIEAWASRISERDGARSFHAMLKQIESFMEALRQASSTSIRESE